jgi:hypothetical protein
MNLKEIRQWFVQESGRYELVVDATNWADNGANRYINAAQNFLDRLQTTPKTLGRNFQVVAAGTYFVNFPRCRAIKEVWVVPTTDTTASRTRLEKKSSQWIREEYPNMNDLTNGTPLYYTPSVDRIALEPVSLPIQDAPTVYLDIQTDLSYYGVFFYPPVDEQYMIETWGYFYAQELSADTDTSFWSITYPELLVMAAQYMLELFNRNTEGAKDWLNSITSICRGVDLDLVEEEVVDVNQMEG